MTSLMYSPLRNMQNVHEYFVQILPPLKDQNGHQKQMMALGLRTSYNFTRSGLWWLVGV